MLPKAGTFFIWRNPLSLPCHAGNKYKRSCPPCYVVQVASPCKAKSQSTRLFYLLNLIDKVYLKETQAGLFFMHLPLTDTDFYPSN